MCLLLASTSLLGVSVPSFLLLNVNVVYGVADDGNCDVKALMLIMMTSDIVNDSSISNNH